MDHDDTRARKAKREEMDGKIRSVYRNWCTGVGQAFIEAQAKFAKLHQHLQQNKMEKDSMVNLINDTNAKWENATKGETVNLATRFSNECIRLRREAFGTESAQVIEHIDTDVNVAGVGINHLTEFTKVQNAIEDSRIKLNSDILESRAKAEDMIQDLPSLATIIAVTKKVPKTYMDHSSRVNASRLACYIFSAKRYCLRHASESGANVDVIEAALDEISNTDFEGKESIVTQVERLEKDGQESGIGQVFNLFQIDYLVLAAVTCVSNNLTVNNSMLMYNQIAAASKLRGSLAEIIRAVAAANKYHTPIVRSLEDDLYKSVALMTPNRMMSTAGLFFDCACEVNVIMSGHAGRIFRCVTDLNSVYRDYHGDGLYKPAQHLVHISGVTAAKPMVHWNRTQCRTSATQVHFYESHSGHIDSGSYQQGPSHSRFHHSSLSPPRQSQQTHHFDETLMAPAQLQGSQSPGRRLTSRATGRGKPSQQTSIPLLTGPHRQSSPTVRPKFNTVKLSHPTNRTDDDGEDGFSSQ